MDGERHDVQVGSDGRASVTLANPPTGNELRIQISAPDQVAAATIRDWRPRAWPLARRAMTETRDRTLPLVRELRGTSIAACRFTPRVAAVFASRAPGGAMLAGRGAPPRRLLIDQALLDRVDTSLGVLARPGGRAVGRVRRATTSRGPNMSSRMRSLRSRASSQE